MLNKLKKRISYRESLLIRYIAMAELQFDTVSGLAISHGWKCPPELMNAGSSLRCEVERRGIDIRKEIDEHKKEIEELIYQ